MSVTLEFWANLHILSSPNWGNESPLLISIMLVSKPVKTHYFNITYANYQSLWWLLIKTTEVSVEWRLLITMLIANAWSVKPTLGQLTTRCITWANTCTITCCARWNTWKQVIDILFIIFHMPTPELKASYVLPLERLFGVKRGFACVLNKCEALEKCPLVHDLVFLFPRCHVSHLGPSHFSPLKWSDNNLSQGYFKGYVRAYIWNMPGT